MEGVLYAQKCSLEGSQQVAGCQSDTPRGDCPYVEEHTKWGHYRDLRLGALAGGPAGGVHEDSFLKGNWENLRELNPSTVDHV